MSASNGPPTQRKIARGAWRDPSALELTKRNALDQLESTTAAFESRWGFEKLRALDPELYEALADQRDMLTEACGPLGQLSECIEHRDAMRRGWAAANAAMEEALVGRVVEIFPGARKIAVRQKPEHPFAAERPDEPPLPVDDGPTSADPEDEPDAA